MEHTLSSRQLLYLSVTFLVGSAMLLVPVITTVFAKQDAWISMLLAMLLGIGLNAGWLFFIKSYQYESIYVIMERILGKWLGKFVNIQIIFLYLYLNSLIVRNLSNFSITHLLPHTHPWIYQILVLLLVMYSSSKGMSNIGRVNEVILPVMIISYLLILSLVLGRFSFDNIRPILANGWFPVIQGVYPVISFPFMELFCFSAFLTYVPVKKKIVRGMISMIILSGILLTLGILITIGVQSAPVSANQLYPTFSIAKLIVIGQFFQRFEAVIGIIWFLGVFLKITLCFLMIMFGLAQISGRQHHYTPFILPTALLLWAMSNQVVPDFQYYNDFVSKVWTIIVTVPYITVFTAFVYGAATGKHKKAAF